MCTNRQISVTIVVKVSTRQGGAKEFIRLHLVRHAGAVLVPHPGGISRRGNEAGFAALEDVDGTATVNGPNALAVRFQRGANGQIIITVAVEIAGGQRIPARPAGG